MVEQLTQEQIDSFPRFRDKWTNIGRSTGRADLSVVKPIINKIYEQKDLEAPKYFFHFGNPMDMLNGRVICRMLSSFDPKNYQKDTINLDNDFMRIFDMTYQMYSEQFDLKSAHGVDWSEDIKLGMLSHCQNLLKSKNMLAYRKELETDVLYGNHEAHNLAYYEFWDEWFKFDFLKPMHAFFELANHLGWWCAEKEVAYLSDKPDEVHVDELGRLHNTAGPAVKYRDDFSIYCIESHSVPAHVVEAPDTITVEEIDSQTNAEVRRIFMTQFGFERYFQEANCQIIDQDFTVVDYNKKESMPRMLVKTKFDDVYLIGTDGSTNRVYYMPIGNATTIKERLGVNIKTCKQAHEIISGVKESNIISQS